MPEYVGHIDNVDSEYANHWIDTKEQIVRCGDCKFADCPEDHFPWCKKTRVPVSQNGFCAWGEKRNGERFTGRGFVVDYTDQTECAAYTCLTCGERSYASAPKYCPQCGVRVGG